MNLKESFRYQNKLLKLMEEANAILSRERNVVKVENTILQHKVDPTAEDVVAYDIPDSEFAEQINGVVSLLMALLNEREKLSLAIRVAKQSMPLDFDGEVSLNAKRQETASTFRKMAEIRSSEKILANAGTGYRFNADGNQVSYRCDLKKVTTINFDRNKVRTYAAALNKKADQISAELDRCMVNTEVDYEAPFDANDSFAEILQQHMDRNN